jgi:hypothetical protein
VYLHGGPGGETMANEVTRAVAALGTPGLN